MNHPFLIGKKLYLRSLEESDINDDYVSWLNNFDVTRYMETGNYPSTTETIRSFFKRFQGSATDLAFAIIDKKTDQHIGNVTLNRINWIHRTVDTGLMMGRDGFQGKGYAFEAWSLVIDYAFQRLGLRKIIAGAVVDNKASISVLQKLGFKLEGTFREEFYSEGTHGDVIRLGLLRTEFHKST